VVGDIMTRHVPVVRENAGLAEVLDSVVSTRLNRAVVVDESGRVVGVVSDTQVLQHLDPHRRVGFLQALMGRARAVISDATQLTARDIMRRPPLVAAPEEPIASAARRMVEERRKVLSVVDSDGVLLGVIDRAHILAAARHADGA
jgi:predicted transcriptional regulator